jgi:integrase
MSESHAIVRGRWGRRKGLRPGTLAFQHNIVSAALQAAVLEGLVQKNVAVVVVKPRQRNDGQDVLEHCWTSPEAKAFVATAKAASPQTAAFYALALDSGARRNELAGLRWADLDLANARVRIERQLEHGRPGARVRSHEEQDAPDHRHRCRDGRAPATPPGPAGRSEASATAPPTAISG